MGEKINRVVFINLTLSFLFWFSMQNAAKSPVAAEDEVLKFFRMHELGSFFVCLAVMIPIVLLIQIVWRATYRKRENTGTGSPQKGSRPGAKKAD